MERRTFTREFKLEVVRQITSGEKRPSQICREHQLSEGLVGRWRQEVEAYGEAAFTPGPKSEIETLERKVSELERFCGQLALENAALKKALQAHPSRNGTR
jgi:transposase